MKRIGFLVNPIAGMGGRVGLKGTDGVVEEARTLGAEPVAPRRAEEALREFVRSRSEESGLPEVRWLTCSGEMGEDLLREAGIGEDEIEVVHPTSRVPSVADTREAVKSFLAKGADLVLFCGGDGTARDICAVAGPGVPILGIPSGVKMYSGVFGTSPPRTAGILLAFLQDRITTTQADILDLDEACYRADRWHVRLYHSALTPYEPAYTQSAKAVIEEAGEAEAREEIADSLAEQFAHEPGTLVLLGPGSTVKAIADRWGIEKTLLGIDAVVDGELVGRDLDEARLLELSAEFERKRLVLSPIGAQGFLLGRGNLQLSPGVIGAIGIENITVIATPGKLARTPVLRFDTGDPDLDAKLTRKGYLLVETGYRQRRVVKTAT